MIRVTRLAQETAHTISTLQVSKVQKIEVVEEKDCLLNKFKKILKQALEEARRKAKLKCFNCGKGGNFPKKLESAMKKSRSVSPINGQVTSHLHQSPR